MSDTPYVVMLFVSLLLMYTYMYFFTDRYAVMLRVHGRLKKEL